MHEVCSVTRRAPVRVSVRRFGTSGHLMFWAVFPFNRQCVFNGITGPYLSTFNTLRELQFLKVHLLFNEIPVSSYIICFVKLHITFHLCTTSTPLYLGPKDPIASKWFALFRIKFRQNYHLHYMVMKHIKTLQQRFQ